MLTKCIEIISSFAGSSAQSPILPKCPEFFKAIIHDPSCFALSTPNFEHYLPTDWPNPPKPSMLKFSSLSVIIFGVMFVKTLPSFRC